MDELQPRTIENDLFGKPRRKKTINQKKKGNANELVAAKVLEGWTGEPFARVPSSGGLRWKAFEGVCGDLVCENKKFNFPFSVETKHLQDFAVGYELRKNSLIYTRWKQAVRDAARAAKEPILLIRRNGMAKGSFYLFLDEKFAVHLPSCNIAPTYRGEGVIGYDSVEFFTKVPYAYIVKLKKRKVL